MEITKAEKETGSMVRESVRKLPFACRSVGYGEKYFFLISLSGPEGYFFLFFFSRSGREGDFVFFWKVRAHVQQRSCSTSTAHVSFQP